MGVTGFAFPYANFWVAPGKTGPGQSLAPFPAGVLQVGNEMGFWGGFWVISFAKPADVWCNSANFPTRRLARGTGGIAKVQTTPRPPVPAPYV